MTVLDSRQKSSDYRSTVYWNPLIETDVNGNAKIEFWNTDNYTSLQVALEGISKAGKPGVAVYNYRVKGEK